MVLILEGRVSDASSGQGIPGVAVSLSQQALDDGTFVSAFLPVSSVLTSGGGNFRIEFERANASAYRLEFRKSVYFARDLSINPGLVKPDIPYAIETSLSPMAWVHASISNDMPQSENDLISFNYVNADFSCNCCANEEISLQGMFIDTNFVCALPGNYNLRYFVNVNKDTTGYLRLDSVVCHPFDTTFIEISY